MTSSLLLKQPPSTARRKQIYAILVLIIFYSAGIFGLLYPTTVRLFSGLSPYIILFSAIILFYFHNDWNRKFLVYIISIFIAGWLIEVFGAQTGVVFGHYYYGSSLGLKILGVPIVMGVNWVILIYSTGIICYKLPVPRIFKALIAAILMVLIDVVMEPVAIKFDFWHWSNLDVPIQNYLAWFIISFLMLSAFFLIRFKKLNKVAPALYIIMLLFFTMLNLFI